MPPVTYPLGIGDLAGIDFGPGRLLLLGGSPGAGKAALAMQCVFDMLALRPELKAVVANVEMPPAMLLERQLSRLSGVPLTVIRKRQFTDEQRANLAAGLDAMRPVLVRLAFVGSPFTVANVGRAALGFRADVVVVDYVQRFKAGDGGRTLEERANIDAVMGELRSLCNAGLAVLAIAALNRVSTRPTRGTNAAAGLSLSSFRGSAELEYACDDAYLMNATAPVTIHHAKSRYGECRDVTLTFNKSVQTFIPDGTTAAAVVPASLPPASSGINAKAGGINKPAGKFDLRAALEGVQLGAGE